MACDVGGMPGDGLLIVQDQFWPTGGARGRECQAWLLPSRFVRPGVGCGAI
jgi:hypothetical protein